MALQKFRCLRDTNINGDPHKEGDIVDMTQEQVERFGLADDVEVYTEPEPEAPAESETPAEDPEVTPAPEAEQA